MLFTCCQNYKILNSYHAVFIFYVVSCFHACLDYVLLCTVPCWFFKNSDTLRLKYGSKIMSYYTVPYPQPYCITLIPCHSMFYSIIIHDWYWFRTLDVSRFLQIYCTINFAQIGKTNEWKYQLYIFFFNYIGSFGGGRVCICNYSGKM
jgi:hypothetical protein